MLQQEYIRNFAIIAHVDHGKSTLSDRLLEITKTIAKDKLGEQFLDQNPISKKRGITIKLAPVRMRYVKNNETYMLNLIDTPGHVDFSYEVSRTLAACEGVVLLVDATQGVQAQTVAHFLAAKKEKLVIIPAINKIDLPNAQTDMVISEMEKVFGINKAEIILLSAKTGHNVQALLDRVIDTIPSPLGSTDKPLRTLIFDAAYDEYRGVVAYVRIVDGNLKVGETIQFYQNKETAIVTEVGYFSPFLTSSKEITTGEIGYIIAGIKDIRQTRVGDTIMKINQPVGPLPGYKLPQSMVFFGIYPKYSSDYPLLKDSLGKLTLNDTSLTYTDEYSAYLGSGFRVGFLGLLHAEIVKERLSQEFGLDLLLTQPQVMYEKKEDSLFEPYMLLSIYIPPEYIGGIMTVCQQKKGVLLDMTYHETYTVLSYEMPYSMFIRGLAGEIKSISSGFASMDYELIEYKPADVVNLEIRINDTPIDVLSELVYKDEAVYRAREKTGKLKDALPRQQFRQVIQAVVNGSIVAREEISPFRKDVLAKMSGGDRTRKDKLLEAQKKGKKKMIQTGKVSLPQEALFSLVSKE